MPSYSFFNKKTGEKWTEFMSISAYDQYIIDNPDVSIDFSNSKPPGLSFNDLPYKKPPEQFREILKSIKKGNKGSNINTW